MAGLISVLLVGGVGFGVWKYVLPALDFARPEAAADDYPGPGQGEVEVVIPDGATGVQMGQVLVDAGVVLTKGAFVDAYTANPDAGGIQPGTYRMAMEMRAVDAVTRLLDPQYRVQTKVTIPEGYSVTQILDKLSSVAAVSVEDLQSAMADTVATGLPAEAGGSYEGWLFASTYTFEPGTAPAQMIAAMVAQTVSVLDARGVAAADRQRVLTMASLVEEEARSPEDRAKVARAIQNRLDIGMKLDIDASVAYGAGKPGTELTDADMDADTPYNLYLRTGLPPTPIAAPSEVSIDAVLNPADGPWLWWVAVNLDTGETKFAETYAEHQQNVAELRAWQAANGG